MRISAGVALAFLAPSLARCAIWYQPLTTSTTEAPLSPKVIAANTGNYSISFVPLITLLSGIIPRIINRIRTPTTDARELDSPKPNVPTEFNGANPCLDSILVRRPYPGNPCFFYQCELYEPSTPTCKLQILHDPDSPRDIDYATVERKSSLLRISECLAIRLYTCSTGHIYDKNEKKCVKQPNLYYGEGRCISN